MEKKIILIGAGLIGRRLYQRIVAKGWEVPFIVTRKGIFEDIELNRKVAEQKDYLSFLDDISAVCLTISTLDDGTTALNYMDLVLERGIPVVTSEKGALGNYFPELRERLKKIGYNASVGGGSKLLRMAERVDGEVEEIYAVLNGTLNYCLDGMSRGRTIYEVTEEVKRLGYAEPRVTSPLDIFNQESTKDIPMKTAILFNVFFPGESLRAREISPSVLREVDFHQLIREAGKRRFIISITKENMKRDTIGGFERHKGEWAISGGFVNKEENPLFMRSVPTGVNNSVLICKGEHGRDGTPCIVGEGAGPDPTTAVMMEDLTDLIG